MRTTVRALVFSVFLLGVRAPLHAGETSWFVPPEGVIDLDRVGTELDRIVGISANGLVRIDSATAKGLEWRAAKHEKGLPAVSLSYSLEGEPDKLRVARQRINSKWPGAIRRDVSDRTSSVVVDAQAPLWEIGPQIKGLAGLHARILGSLTVHRRQEAPTPHQQQPQVDGDPPDDPAWREGEQWWLEACAAQEICHRTWAPSACGVPQRCREVLVAVIDSGVFPHPDLQAWSGKDGVRGVRIVNNKYSYDVDDPDGHGTACAGIVSAWTHNADGIAGVCSTAVTIPICPFPKEKCPSVECVIPIADLSEAIKLASDFGAEVAVLPFKATLESDSDARALTDAVRYARGTLFVCAAGNDGNKLDNALNFFPSVVRDEPNVLIVGASAPNGARAKSSNYGPDVHLLAPASSAYSLGRSKNSPNPFDIQSDYFRLFGWTSAASSLAAGAAARIRSAPKARWLTPEDVKAFLIEHVAKGGKVVPQDCKAGGILSLKEAKVRFFD